MKNGLACGVGLALGLLLQVQTASAQRPGALPEWAAKVFEADSNGDKRVTFAELHAKFEDATPEHFYRIDRNKDGIITARDRPGAPPNPRQVQRNRRQRLQALEKLLESDLDGDDRVTYHEVQTVKPGYPRPNFDRLDVNRDSVLSNEDAARLRDAIRNAAATIRNRAREKGTGEGTRSPAESK